MGELRIPPSFIEPPVLANLTEAQQEELLTGIRERRLLAVAQYLASQEERKAVKEAVYQKKYDVRLTKIGRNIEKIDELLGKLEQEFYKLRALKLEALDI